LKNTLYLRRDERLFHKAAEISNNLIETLPEDVSVSQDLLDTFRLLHKCPMRFMANEGMVQARFSRLLEAMSIFANEVKPPTPRRGPFWYHPKVFTCADSESIRPDFVGGKLKHDRTWPFTKKLTAVEIKTPPVMKQLLDKLERKREWQEWQEVEWRLTVKTPE
jgi:hypothetical protein